MKIVKSKDGGRNERMILTGVITNKAVLGAVAAQWDGKLFSSRWANIVAGWCVAHYRKFRKAPGRKVTSLFDRWAEGHAKDKDTVGLVGAFLADLSAEYTSRRADIDPDYVIDMAKEWFDRVKLQTLGEEIEGLLADGDVKEALRRANALRPVELGLGSMIRPLEDRSALDEVLSEKHEVLIRYPGALGEFFGDSLEREGFVCFEGPEKRGKSTILLDLAWTAMEQGRRVAMFQLGDLSKRQFNGRLYSRACGRPVKPTPPGKTVQIPNYLGPPSAEGAAPDVRFDERRWDKLMGRKFADRCLRRVVKRQGKDLLRLSVHPAGSLSVHGAASILDGWERHGWRADVVIFDYADLFAPLDGKQEGRDQINATWRAMSGLRLAKHCLVVTATQTDADSYESDVIGMKNFSEDKRKRSHVTGSVGINQKDSEKELGIYRFNWVVGRDWAYNSSKCVYAAGCAAIQSPMMFSTF